VLVLAAADDSGDLAVLARAGASLGLDVQDLTAAEEEGLITVDQGVAEFRHPLARSALYAAAPASERRAAHAALAAALPDRDVDRRAWHLAASSVGPDDVAADALEQAGARARERSAYAVAAAAFERAGGLSVTDERRAELLVAAADAAWLGGDAQRTLALLDSARLHAANDAVVARIDRLDGRVAVHRGPVADGARLLVRAADRIADSDPDLAVEMLAEAVHAGFYAGDIAGMGQAAERGRALSGRNGSRRAVCFAAMSRGMASIAHGEGEAGAAAIRQAVEILEQSEELREDPRLLALVSLGPMWLREAEGRTLLDLAFERARGLSALGVLPKLLQHLARDQAATDKWPLAEASFDEAIRLARETGQRAELAAAFAGLCWLEARQGREERCRADAAEGERLCTELGMGTYRVWTIQALGDLELALGRPEAALGHYLAQVQAMRDYEFRDVDLSPGPELVEIHLRLGDVPAADAAADELYESAEEKGQPWSRARAARARGLLADADEVDDWFSRAFELHARTPDVFEAARTRLAYGARLRRTRQRVRAREELREALAMFEALGAPTWADQASAELAATGETARRRDPSTLDDLTPQELQIARLLASGMTTREAAAAVFLSPKTIEYHLRHVYRKLGIRSREELARAIGVNVRWHAGGSDD
jgi:DNA-binding CsgD family transcriptional regulator